MLVITNPTKIMATGNVAKSIYEYFGGHGGQKDISIARMHSPSGRALTSQTPEFDEYTLVISGTLKVETNSGTRTVAAGHAVIIRRGEWVRYSTPAEGGADYVSVCIPAFSPHTVNRDSLC